MKEINNRATAKIYELVGHRSYKTTDLEEMRSILSQGADPNCSEEN